MNVHGKNNSRHGPFGDHVQSFELLTASGELLTCSREERPELFFATIGGLGLLGAVVRLTLKLRRVYSGRLRVFATTARNLDESLERFESLLPKHDYVVGWVDAFARGSNLCRIEIHAASHLTPLEDPKGAASLNVAAQSLPTTLWGLPRAEVWRFMRPFANRPGMTLVNAVKFNLARIVRERTYLQSHAAFAFLLDYIPDWRLAYGDGGFIQHQLFVPYHCANRCIKQVLLTCQKAEIIPYLAVLKRHRPDPFLLSHALDGWSLALDFRITESTRTAVWDVTKRLTAQVLDVNGKFYFAKDAVLTPEDVERAYGHDRVKQFLVLKRDIDPTGLFGSDLSERVFATQTR
jgi:FAD/FMN-containing dehydrogenase